MTYEYACTGCNRHFDVIKSVKAIEVNEFCPTCKKPGVRQFVPSHIHLTGTSVQHPEYNPGLGQVVKNSKHRDEIAKRKGLVEVGNDFGSGEKIQTQFDRAREDKRKKAYEDI